jgi:hypothetical protein
LEHLHQQTQYFLNILNTYNQVVSYTSYTETYLAEFNNYLVFPHIDYTEGAKLAKRIVYTIRFQDPVRIGPTYKFIFLYAHATEAFSKDPFSVPNPVIKYNNMNANDLRTVMEGVFGTGGVNITNLTTQLTNTAAANQPRELSLVKVDPFYGKDDEDPHEWIDLFNQAATANQWAAGRKVAIAAGYLKEAAHD